MLCYRKIFQRSKVARQKTVTIILKVAESAKKKQKVEKMNKVPIVVTALNWNRRG
jgi:hypothetical protein